MKHKLLHNRHYPQQKHVINPLVGAALVSGVGSLFSGLFGSAGQSSANKNNLQATRETNAQNYQMFQEQMAFNKQMTAEQNEYNSPENQRKRLLSAGINPLAAQIGSQQAQALSAPSPNPAIAPQFQNVMGSMANGIMNSSQQISQALLQSAQIKKASEEARKLKIENDKQEYEVDALKKPYMFFVGEDGKQYAIDDGFGNKTIGERLAYNKFRVDIDKLKPELQRVKAEADKADSEAFIADVEAKNAETRVSLENALKRAEETNKNALTSKTRTEITEIQKNIELLGKKIILAQGEIEMQSIQKELMAIERDVQNTSKSLLTKGFSLETVGDLFKVLLISLVNNLGGSFSFNHKF